MEAGLLVWPEGYRLVSIEAYRDGSGPGVAGRRSLDDYADQVYAVAEDVGVPVHLVGRPRGSGRLRLRAVRTESTVVEAETECPTDAAPAAHGGCARWRGRAPSWR